MLIVKTFSYDSDDHPKVHEWCKRMGKTNFSDCIRRLIESQTEIDMLAELRKIQHKLDNMQIANVFAEPQIIDRSPIVIPAETPVNNDVEFNKNSLKNRYKL